MPVTHKNRLRTTVSAVASAGLGAFTISTASSGYRSFVAGDDGKTFDVVITEGTTWEVRTGCAYTHSGTSLARGTLEDSSTGSAITFTSDAIVTVTASAGFGNNAENTFQAVTPGGRLTLETGVPVSVSDQTGKTTIYYTPYTHNIINLWDGAEWVPTIFAETSEALGTLTDAKNYDVFGFLASGALDIEILAWTNDSTRATAVTLQDGRYCKSGDKTRLLLGTFRTTSTTTTEDSYAKRLVSNVYNQLPTTSFKEDLTDNSYASTTPRYWNNSSSNKLEFLFSMSDAYLASVYSSAGSSGLAGLWPIDTASGTPKINAGTFSASGGAVIGAAFGGVAAAGYHYIGITQYSSSGVSVDFYDVNATVLVRK